MEWLGKPLAIVKAYVAMLPRLLAEESLTEMNRTAIGTGSMKQETATRWISKWKRAASGSTASPAKARFNLDAIAAAGIGIRKVAK